MFANATDFALGFGITNWPEAHRHTHTPPVRGEHPACSRNCQAGLTAGTPCCAFRGLSGSPFLAVTLTEAILVGRSARPWKLFFPFPERTYRCRSPPLQSPNKGPFVSTFAPGLLTQRLPFAWPSATRIGKLAQTIEPPNPQTLPRVAREDAVTRPRVARPESPVAPWGARRGQVKPARPRRPGGEATLLTLRSPRAAWQGCGARCGVRDPGRCGPSRCWPRRGLGLGGGASLLGWERPAGQGGSEQAESPPRPTAARGRPRLPGALPPAGRSLPEGAATTATGPRPGRSPQPVGGEGAVHGGPGSEGGGGGADRARDARHARSAGAPAARSALTEPRANFSGGALRDQSALRFPKPLPALGDPARPGSAHSAPSSAPPPQGWLGRPGRARGGRRSSPGRRARAPTHPAPWPCREPRARSRLCHLALQK